MMNGHESEKLDFATIQEEEIDCMKLDYNKERWALCLSGGGVRSATFSLGVLQGLAKRDLLGKFHYLSTVSGGGFIGSWLSSWIARDGIDNVQEALAGELHQGQPTVDVEPKQVSWLRSYSNYLSPVAGLSIDSLTLVSIYLRNLFLNWLVLIPLLLAALILPRLYLSVLSVNYSNGVGHNVLLILSAIFVGIGIAYAASDQPGKVSSSKKPVDYFGWFCFAPILVGSALLGLFCGWLADGCKDANVAWCFVCGGAAVFFVGYLLGWVFRRVRGIKRSMASLAEYLNILFLLLLGGCSGGLVYLVLNYVQPHLNNFGHRELYATLAVPLLLLIFWLATSIYVGVASKTVTESDREWWARAGAWLLLGALGWILAFVLVIYAPQWIFMLPGMDSNSTTYGAGGGVLGILISLYGYWSKNGATIKSRAQGFAEVTGVRLMELCALVFTIALLIVLCFLISWGESVFSDTPNVDRYDPVFSSTTYGHRESVSHKDVLGRSAELSNTVAKAASDTLLAAQATQAAALALLAISGVADSSPVVHTQMESALFNAVRATEVASHGMNLSAGNMFSPEKSGGGEAYAKELRQGNPSHLVVALLVLILIGVVMASTICSNKFSLHSLYGNRLVRAYLGATRVGKRNPHWFTGFDPEDNRSMASLKQMATQEDPSRLFHVINIALNITDDKGRLEWQQRKAQSFTVSPLHAGNETVGYVDVTKYGRNGQGISLGAAMTISGAAASPNMGYHSSKMVAFVMTIFNVRLGWWLPNPRVANPSSLQRTNPQFGVLDELFSKTNDTSDYIYLSDGGHFENLGLYEMVKRRCRRIMLVDASCDPEFKFDDLENAIRKIRIDLGVPIDFKKEELPVHDRVKNCKCHYTIGTIHYSTLNASDPDGVICYIKPVLCDDEPLDVTRYAERNKKFPHQSTADQFFDEAQFESYRMLGIHSVENWQIDENGWPMKPSTAPDKPTNTNADGTKPNCVCGTKCCNGGLSNDERSASQIANIADSLKSLGQGALLASAITVVGVIGVTGTVALRDSTVSLKQDSVVGVTGNVALSNPTVSLQPIPDIRMHMADLNRLDQGIRLNVDEHDKIKIEPIKLELGAIEGLSSSLATNANKISEPLGRIASSVSVIETSITGIGMNTEAIQNSVATMAGRGNDIRGVK